MIISTPTDLLQMSEGVVPEAITGVLTNLQANPTEGGEGDNAYKFQNATLTQDGQSIRITFSNRENVSQDLVGKQIIAKCRKNQKGLYGLKRKTGREYQGETPPEIWVYAGAELSTADGTATPQPQQTAQVQAQPASDTNGIDPLVAIKKQFLQMGNAFCLCYDTAYWVAKRNEHKHGISMSEAQIQAVASSMFIKADRNGIVDRMPKNPIKEGE